MSGLRSVLRMTGLLAVALLIPVLPLLVLGLSFEERVESLVRQEWSVGLQATLIVGLLAVDLFLPIPSSAVSTYAGGVLGTWTGTVTSWLGMTLGAVIGFWLARGLGHPFARRLAGTDDLRRMEGLTRRFGPVALLLTRALPILAEACVLLMGAGRLSWGRFLPPVVAANLVISLVYAACGEYFEGRDALAVAAVASGTVPLAVALLLRRWLPASVWDETDEPPG